MKCKECDDRKQEVQASSTDENTVGALSDDEKLRAFLKAIENNVAVPFDGFVIGEPISVIAFDYDGNTRRGLTARCRREDGSEHVVPVSEIAVPSRTKGRSRLAAYRQWLGLESNPSKSEISIKPPR
jgi:hypothetical protein